MHLLEECISSEEKFSGRVFKVRLDKVKLENGKTASREVVHHNGGVCILPLTAENEVIFVKQFRYPYMETVLELPAGKLEIGEDHAEAGKRELLEETGCTCKKYTFLGKLYPSPGYVDEIIYLYLAEDLEYSQQSLDEDEFLDIVKIPFDKAIEMVMANEIPDSKSQVCLFKTYMMKEKKGSID